MQTLIIQFTVQKLHTVQRLPKGVSGFVNKKESLTR